MVGLNNISFSISIFSLSFSFPLANSLNPFSQQQITSDSQDAIKTDLTKEQHFFYIKNNHLGGTMMQSTRKQ